MHCVSGVQNLVYGFFIITKCFFYTCHATSCILLMSLPGHLHCAFKFTQILMVWSFVSHLAVDALCVCVSEGERKGVCYLKPLEFVKLIVEP